MAKWMVNYDGWLVVEADNEQQADTMAMSELNSARLPCDGVTGEWYTLNAEPVEDDEDLDTQWQDYQESMVE